jgi:hypothetical protein
MRGGSNETESNDFVREHVVQNREANPNIMCSDVYYIQF